MPEYGTFNLHASLLPDYRGAAPINWAIINGEQKTGITTFFIDKKIDTGHIIEQKEIEILDTDTAGTLHDRLMISGASLVIDTIKQIENDTVITIAQPKETELKTAYKLHRENTKINWNDNLQSIYNLIRGLSPYPVAWCSLINNTTEMSVKIYDAIMSLEKHNFDIGKVILEDTEIKVAVKNGYLIINKIQLPGKKAMDAKALLNGFSFHEDARMV